MPRQIHLRLPRRYIPGPERRSELVFTDILWPDLRRENLYGTVREFQARDRRYSSTDSRPDHWAGFRVEAMACGHRSPDHERGAGSGTVEAMTWP